MCLYASSASYWPQTKVISLVKSSLVLILVTFLGLETKVVFSSPVQVQYRNQVLLNRCIFIPHRQSLADLIECMNNKPQLSTVIKRKSRATEENENAYEIPEYNQRYSPTNPTDYPQSPDLTGNPRSFFNLNIFNAMSLISKYDDYKCIPRIICEMATGVIPEISKYKQSYSNAPINTLISFLSSLNIEESSSPLLLFGKSALMGYSNKGNPEICYHQYPRCPRNPNDLVNYLNNYNGGFFKFFNNQNSRPSSYYPKAANSNEPSVSFLNPAANLISDRKGTGELKFDIPIPKSRSFEFSINERNVNNKVVFPEDSHHVEELIQQPHYDKKYENNDHQLLQQRSFFPQDRKDQKITEIVYDLDQEYEDLNKEPQASDRQTMMIDIDSSKLLSERFKSTMKKGLINDDVLQPIDLEGLNVINLVELYSEDETQLEQVFHPCDMICHDSKGTSVQFSQVLNYKSLSTFMTPERPILDLSQPLPCQILCRNQHDEGIGIYVTLSQVLRASLDHKKSQEYSSANESLRVKVIKPRFVGDSIVDEKTITPPVTLSDPNSVLLSEMSSMQLTGGQTGILPNLQSWGQRSPIFGGQQGIIPPLGSQFLQDDTPIGDNPLAIVTNASVEGVQSFSGGYAGSSALPASFTMCGSYLYIVPLNAIATPVCTVPINPPMMNQKPLLSVEKNPYGNYTNFFSRLSNNNNNNNDFADVKNEFISKVNSEDRNKFFPSLHQQVTPSKYEGISVATNVQPDVAALNPGDYPQGSCLEGKSWNVDDNQCVPIKSNEDSDYEYTNTHGKPTPIKEQFDKVESSPQRILIQTPNADINIQSN